ncbi:MAG: pantoate--beta-alanine ligase [Spirosomataceae bacterium]
MQLFHTISSLKSFLASQRLLGKSIGFVPTMGALHEGHLSLINKAKSETDLTVCSIFVNPTQFNNSHDLAVYPRTLEADCSLLERVACDVVFAPSADEMYPQMPTMTFDFGDLERVMEGAFRPGHFNGVGIVVSKLFHIVQPDKAFFGQKDLQQCAIVNQLIHNLSFDLEFVVCPTQRETDGLAMSSRNRNLSPEQRSIAPVLYKALQKGRDLLLSGQSSVQVKQVIEESLGNIQAIELEYFEIADKNTLAPIQEYVPEKTALCIAAYLGKTRLIDNILL